MTGHGAAATQPRMSRRQFPAATPPRSNLVHSRSSTLDAQAADSAAFHVKECCPDPYNQLSAVGHYRGCFHSLHLDAGAASHCIVGPSAVPSRMDHKQRGVWPAGRPSSFAQSKQHAPTQSFQDHSMRMCAIQLRMAYLGMTYTEHSQLGHPVDGSDHGEPSGRLYCRFATPYR